MDDLWNLKQNQVEATGAPYVQQEVCVIERTTLGANLINFGLQGYKQVRGDNGNQLLALVSGPEHRSNCTTQQAFGMPQFPSLGSTVGEWNHRNGSSVGNAYAYEPDIPQNLLGRDSSLRSLRETSFTRKHGLEAQKETFQWSNRIQRPHIQNSPGTVPASKKSVSQTSSSQVVPASTSGLRVFTSNISGLTISGELLLTEWGRFEVVCSCHGCHMSVRNFIQHGGSYVTNPGSAVYLENGDTLVQWRKALFLQYGVTVPEDHVGWDWNTGSDMFTNSRSKVTAIASKELDLPDATTRTGWNSAVGLPNQPTHHNGCSSSFSYSNSQDQRQQVFQDAVFRTREAGPTSEYFDFINRSGQAYSTVGPQVNMRENTSHRWNVSQANLRSEKDSHFSSIELRLGQPSQQAHNGSPFPSTMQHQLSDSAAEQQRTLLYGRSPPKAFDTYGHHILSGQLNIHQLDRVSVMNEYGANGSLLDADKENSRARLWTSDGSLQTSKISICSQTAGNRAATIESAVNLPFGIRQEDHHILTPVSHLNQQVTVENVIGARINPQNLSESKDINQELVSHECSETWMQRGVSGFYSSVKISADDSLARHLSDSMSSRSSNPTCQAYHVAIGDATRIDSVHLQPERGGMDDFAKDEMANAEIAGTKTTIDKPHTGPEVEGVMSFVVNKAEQRSTDALPASGLLISIGENELKSTKAELNSEANLANAVRAHSENDDAELDEFSAPKDDKSISAEDGQTKPLISDICSKSSENDLSQFSDGQSIEEISTLDCEVKKDELPDVVDEASGIGKYSSSEEVETDIHCQHPGLSSSEVNGSAMTESSPQQDPKVNDNKVEGKRRRTMKWKPLSTAVTRSTRQQEISEQRKSNLECDTLHVATPKQKRSKLHCLPMNEVLKENKRLRIKLSESQDQRKPDSEKKVVPRADSGCHTVIKVPASANKRPPIMGNGKMVSLKSILAEDRHVTSKTKKLEKNITQKRKRLVEENDLVPQKRKMTPKQIEGVVPKLRKRKLSDLTKNPGSNIIPCFVPRGERSRRVPGKAEQVWARSKALHLQSAKGKGNAVRERYESKSNPGRASKPAEKSATKPSILSRKKDGKSARHRDARSKSESCCCVCGNLSSEGANLMISCGSCSIKVHQACYGISKVPRGDWECRACKANVNNIACVLCGYDGGAMTRAQKTRGVVKGLLKVWNSTNCTPSKKNISLGGHHLDVQNSIVAAVNDPAVTQWVHMVCALWMPGTRCLNLGTMGMFDVSGVTAARKKLICSICDRPGGSCIQCQVSKCAIPFHVWCAHKQGLLQIETVNDEGGHVRFHGKCMNHGATLTDKVVKKRSISLTSSSAIESSNFSRAEVNKKDDNTTRLNKKTSGSGLLQRRKA